MHHHMHGLIKHAGDEWRLLEDSKATKISKDTLAETRQWPLLIAASCASELKALDEIRQRHVDAAPFENATAGKRTLQLSNRLFKLLSRQGARYQELLAKHRRCPFLVFDLLNDAEATKEKLRKKCDASLDPYTRSFLAHYGIDSCDSPDARAELTLIAVLAQVNTLPLENGNAGIRHIIDIMSTHVVLPLIGRVSADKLLSKARSWLRRFHAPPGTKTTSRAPRITAKQRRLAARAKRAGRPVPKKKASRTGGGCRAYVSARARGSVGKTDLQALAAEWNALSPAEQAPYKADGARATAAGRHGGVPFGPKPREQARAVEQASKRRRVEAIADGSQAVALRNVGDIVAFSSDLQVAKATARTVNAARRDANHDAATTFKDWRDTEGVRRRDELVVGAPALGPVAPALSSSCDAKKECLYSWAYPLDKCVPRALASLRRKDPRLLARCTEDWEQVWHDTVLHCTQASIKDPPKRKQTDKPPCVDVDCCLCGDHGDNLFAFKLWLCKEMSVHLHTPELRESLAEGNIVIRLLSSYGDDNDDLPDSDRPDEVDQWYHVSLHFFSPYKPWLREVTWLSDIEDPCGHYHLLALHKYYTLWQMIDHIYLAASEWDIRFYK